jgi:hypothetical protein
MDQPPDGQLPEPVAILARQRDRLEDAGMAGELSAVLGSPKRRMDSPVRVLGAVVVVVR